MLNKLKFNNLIISNKKGIQQSRIQTINKLVHKIRKLKTLLAKRPEDDKCKERIRKSIESMEMLKKYKLVEIMKHVLLLEKPPAAVITNGLSTPDELAVALLAMNKIMQGLIKRFKTELNLTESSDGKWQEQLRENSKRRQKIERTEQKKLKRKTMKEQKVMGNKRKEWLEQNCENADNNLTADGEEANMFTEGTWKVEEVDIANKLIESQVMNTEPELPEMALTEASEIKVENKLMETKMTPQAKTQNDKKVIMVKPKPKPTIKTENLSEIVKFINYEPSEDSNVLEHKVASEIENDDDEETHVVDPFFVTETGENYLSTAVIKRIEGQQESNAEPQQDMHMVKLNGFKNKRNFREQNNEVNDRQKQRIRANNDRKDWKENRNNRQKTHNTDKNQWPKKNDRFSQMTNKSATKLTNNPKQSTGIDEKLHPSWAAKQKLKPVITGFQGKKIKFDDGISNDAANNVSFDTKSNLGKNNTSATIKSNTDSIHPSWAAKQKQKPIITAFQGKKITFGNDE